MTTTAKALTRKLFLDAERDAQRIAAGLRLALGAVLLAIALVADAGELDNAPASLALVAVYFCLGIASLVVTHERLFATAWAPAFVVLDVLWYYATLIVELHVFDAPPNEFPTMPVFVVLFVLIALAGMRYTPWALLAGLATFAVLDVTFYLTVVNGLWPGAPVSDDPRFEFGVNVFRIAAVAATGLVVGLISLRARRTLVRALETRAERDAVLSLFGRYVPEEVARQMVAQGGALPATSGTATVAFIDIEGFTRRAEASAPEAIVTMMNAYFRRIEAVIRQHHGVVAHFQGDGVLATFNLPLPRLDHADQAVAAGQAILALVDEETFAGERLQVRVGIATGDAAAGVVGGEDRLAYTLYGDVVNVAARLEQANKRLGTRLLVAGATAAAMRNSSSLHDLGEQTLPGRDGTLHLLTPGSVAARVP